MTAERALRSDGRWVIVVDAGEHPYPDPLPPQGEGEVV